MGTTGGRGKVADVTGRGAIIGLVVNTGVVDNSMLA